MKAQRQSCDRISGLPQDTIEKILTLMPIRDALRTSILSSRWRYCWTGVPKLEFDDRQLIVSSGNKEINQDKFVKAIFHVLLLHRAPILEFSLHISRKTCREIDQIILHLSRSNDIKKFIFKMNSTWETGNYRLPCSFFSLQGLEHLDLSYCRFEPPSMYKGFSKLKSLCFFDVYITNTVVLGFLANCPLLVEFTWTSTDHNEVDIELTEGELVELFTCLPSIQVLEISKLHIEHLAAGSMPHKLPNSLVHLRILVLSVCLRELFSVLCVMSSSPNLEKIKLEICPVWLSSQQTLEKLHDLQDFTGLKLDHFKELEIITRFQDCGSWMQFLKIVMARSPILKKAQIELCTFDSVAKEVKMFRDLLTMRFNRASPTAKFIIKWPANSRRKTNEVVMML